MAGACGAGLVLGADAILSGFYGWRLRDHLPLLALLMILGFVAGLFSYLRLAKVSRQARKAERTKIDIEENERSPRRRVDGA